MEKQAKYDDEQLFEMVLMGLSWWEGHFSELIQTVVANVNISFEQFIILYRLDRVQGDRITVKELAADRHVSSSAISRKLNHLIKNGLIELVVDPCDRRYRYLTLTPDGRSVVALIASVNAERLGHFLNGFGRIRTSELIDELRRVERVLGRAKNLE